MKIEMLNPFYYLLYSSKQELESISYRLKNEIVKSEFQLDFIRHPKEFFGWNAFVSKLTEVNVTNIKDFILFHSKEASQNDIHKEHSTLLIMKEKLALYDLYNYNLLFRIVVRAIHYVVNPKLPVLVKFKIGLAIKEIDTRISQIEEIKNEIDLNALEIFDLNSKSLEEKFDMLLNGNQMMRTQYLIEIWYIFLAPIFAESSVGKTSKISKIGEILGLPIKHAEILKLIKDSNGKSPEKLRNRIKDDYYLVIKQFKKFRESCNQIE